MSFATSTSKVVMLPERHRELDAVLIWGPDTLIDVLGSLDSPFRAA